ncbi:uncharacterized protein LOC144747058 [Ciona intestinalis]
MALSRRSPPKFVENDCYVEWRRKISMWQLVSDVKKSEQAIIVNLYALEGHVKAQRAISSLSTEELHCDGGLDILLNKLDEAFKTEKVDEAYSAYVRFNTFSRSSLSINNYILEFEHLYSKICSHGMELSDAVLAFKLMDGANLSHSERQLALTLGADLKLKTMKSSLKRVFGNTEAVSSNVKEEVFENQYMNRKKTPVNWNKKETQRKQNPRNKFGYISRCAICDSKMHWASTCPHKEHNVMSTALEPENVAVTLQTNDDKMEVLSNEAENHAVVDTACTKTVCGQKWFTKFIKSLKNENKINVKTYPSKSSFVFGDGMKVISHRAACIPACIAGVKCQITTEIVNKNIPLLLSKTSLKKAETLIDLKNDKVTMFRNDVNIKNTTSGHYCVSIHPDLPVNNEEVNLLERNESTGNLNKTLIKLHKQFGHASCENMEKLLKSSGKLTPEMSKMILGIVQSCSTCQKYKKPPARPAVGLSWGSDFNDTVAMDLHELEHNIWYFHMIDTFTRFSNAIVIRSKSASIIVKGFLVNWISLFGAPKNVFSDNGREFNNSEFQDMCHNFSITVRTTAAYSPWSNGVCERHNLTLTNMVNKVKFEQKCNWETAVAWSVCAKNAFVNRLGFSPHQLVFGRNINLPSTLTDNQPALNGVCESLDVGAHLSALHAARKAFISAESSEKIRRALRKQTRQTGNVFAIGDAVYYKRDDSPLWRGPVKVLGQDGPVVFLRHGGQYVKVHSCRVTKVNEPHLVSDLDTRDQTNRATDDSNKESESDDSSSDDDEDHSEIRQVPESTVTTLNPQKVSLHPKDKVKFLNQEGIEHQATILGRAGKATGKYKNSYNIEYESPNDLYGKRTWIDFSKVTGLEHVNEETNEPINNETTPQTEESFVITSDIFSEAKKKELLSWRENQVFQEVKNQNQKCVSVRWVCTMKKKGDDMVPKARLVARGFEEQKQNLQRESPTCSKEAVRIMLSVAKQMKWRMNSIDVKTAFLQGELVDRDIYLKPPNEANCPPDVVWKLRKCVYGLVDASRLWYERVRRFMIDAGAKPSSGDQAMFIYHINNVLQGMMCVYVDDILWIGNDQFKTLVIEKLYKTFTIGSESSEKFKYIGLEMKETIGHITVDQSSYIKLLEPINISGCRRGNMNSDVTAVEKELLQRKIGQLLWVSSHTRPDISFDVCVLATNFNKATVKDIVHCNKVIRKLHNEDLKIKFMSLGDVEKLKLVVYSDAAFANLHDGGSQGAFLIFLVGENKKCNILSWQSKRIKRVIRSTLAAEASAACDAVEAAYYLSYMITELFYGKGHGTKLPIHAITDNRSLYDAVHSRKGVADKRLRIDIAVLKEMMETNKLLSMEWVESKKQLADALTKQGVSSIPLFNVLRYACLT